MSSSRLLVGAAGPLAGSLSSAWPGHGWRSDTCANYDGAAAAAAVLGRNALSPPLSSSRDACCYCYHNLSPLNSSTLAAAYFHLLNHEQQKRWTGAEAYLDSASRRVALLLTRSRVCTLCSSHHRPITLAQNQHGATVLTGSFELYITNINSYWCCSSCVDHSACYTNNIRSAAARSHPARCCNPVKRHCRSLHGISSQPVYWLTKYSLLQTVSIFMCVGYSFSSIRQNAIVSCRPNFEF